VIVSLGILPHCMGAASLSVGLFLFAACSASFYPLGLALLGERVAPSSLARANAWYLAINCLGSLLGPMIAGYAMDELGRSALFGVAIVVVALVLGVWMILPLLGLHHTSRGVPPVALFSETRNQEAA
jgi:MFS family permease